jgi:hypothetical protein
MSPTRFNPTRLPWPVRAAQARRRFTSYSNVVLEIERQRALGAKPKGMLWRLSDAEIKALFAKGGEILRAGFNLKPANVAHEHIEQLEKVVDQLAAADDWNRRLCDFLATLQTETARNAFDSLVRFGCVPDDLADCVRCRTDKDEARLRQETQRERLIYLPRLRELAKLFEKLSVRCDKYKGLPERYGGSKFSLDQNVAGFLRTEAASMREFIRDADTRRRGRTRLKADFQLLRTMDEGAPSPVVSRILRWQTS